MVAPPNTRSMGKAIAAFQTEERREKPRFVEWGTYAFRANSNHSVRLGRAVRLRLQPSVCSDCSLDGCPSRVVGSDRVAEPG